MGIANYHISSRIYFNKWRNVAFAVFCSIGKVVIIGEITSILNQLNTVKSAIVNSINLINGESFRSDEIEQEELSLSQLLSEIVVNPVILFGKSQDITSSDYERLNSFIISIYEKALSGPFLILALLSILKLQLKFIR